MTLSHYNVKTYSGNSFIDDLFKKKVTKIPITKIWDLEGIINDNLELGIITRSGIWKMISTSKDDTFGQEIEELNFDTGKAWEKFGNETVEYDFVCKRKRMETRQFGLPSCYANGILKSYFPNETERYQAKYKNGKMTKFLFVNDENGKRKKGLFHFEGPTLTDITKLY